MWSIIWLFIRNLYWNTCRKKNYAFFFSGKCSDVLKFGYEKIRTIKYSDSYLSENKNVRTYSAKGHFQFIYFSFYLQFSFQQQNHSIWNRKMIMSWNILVNQAVLPWPILPKEIFNKLVLLLQYSYN